MTGLPHTGGGGRGGRSVGAVRTPLISVICPVHNRSVAIIDTLGSVIAQSMTDWELIVVLDGCTDDTAVWVESLAATDPRIRVLVTPGFGHPGEPRNRAIAVARGAVIAYLDHDDRWAPTHLRLVAAMIADGADLVATGCRRVDESGALVGASDRIGQCWHPELQLLSPMFEPSRTAHRAGLVQRVGGWRPGVGLEDWDLWVRLADAGFRFRTALDRTVVIAVHRGSRRFVTRRPHRIDLAAFGELSSARAALADLRRPSIRAAHLAAATIDAVRWYRRLDQWGDLVQPVDAAPVDAGDFAVEVATAVRRTASGWPDDVVLVQDKRRVVLGLASWAATADLADRVHELSRRVLTEQLDVIARVAARHGGEPITPPAPTEPGRTR